MKKIVITFGSIAGLIVASMFFITLPFHNSGALDETGGLWIGYTSMVVALSLTFFGIKAYRDKHLGGVISFGRAFKTGLLIVLVATAYYVIGWEIYLAIFGNGYMESYMAGQIKDAQIHGASAAEIVEITDRMQKLATNYKNPVIRMAMTAMEIFPVGLILALICAAILKKREILRA